MRTALVIDDNRHMGDLLAQIVALFDFKVDVAYGSRIALSRLKINTPTIVFLDLLMPGVSGFEVLAYLKREPRLMNVPVIVVTSDDQAETREKAKAAGVVDFIPKPATFEIIEAALKKLELTNQNE